MKKIAFLLLLMGCGPEYKYEYKIQCLTYVSDHELNPQKVEHNLNLAKKWIGGIYDVCKHQNRIVVHQSNGWITSSGQPGTGETILGGDIIINFRGLSLVHEFFHAKEFQEGIVIDSMNHVGWQDKGYNMRDSEFSAEATFLND